MIRLLILLSFLFSSLSSISQDKWKLSKDKEGIKVYLADVPKSDYKNIKVLATMEGTYDKLISVLTNVSKYKDWVYNNKTGYVIKKISPTELYIYTETSLPWPASNRDAVVHMKIDRDKQNRFLKVIEVGVPNYIPEKEDKVRVLKAHISWHVTMPTPSTIQITYFFEADPGGSVPGWLVNSFADKGPYETFKNLKKMLK